MNPQVESILGGGYTVSAGKRWWTVSLRGVNPTIVSDDGNLVGRHSLLGKTILKAVQQHLKDAA